MTIQGSIYDVSIDLRRSSPTFGEWFGIEISKENRNQIWIPPGFAHGFLVTSETAEVLYKATDYWYPESERTLLWNDSTIAINWPSEINPIISDKDSKGRTLRESELYD